MFLRLYSVSLAFIILLYWLDTLSVCIPVLNGHYTGDIENYHLAVPHKISEDGEFLSFHIPTFFDHNFKKRRMKRIANDTESVHFRIHLNDTSYHAELWPNHGFIAPNSAFEVRDPNLLVQDRKIRTLSKDRMCHYTGRVRGHENSRAAISTCNGLSGYLQVDGRRYFIEPVEEHVPNKYGQHLHLIFEKEPEKVKGHKCGTTNWEEGWRNRFREKFLKGVHTKKRSTSKSIHVWEDAWNDQKSFIESGNRRDKKKKKKKKKKRGLYSEHRYIETLIVCDKKFLGHYKNKDVETYVLTIMNMVSDYYHDYSSGNQIDVVVVRVIYLEKEEEEIDLVINQNAEDSLASFCKWQEKVNPKELSNPNHHDIAVLLTRHDICANNVTECGLMGLAYVAGACTGDHPCAINEDGGLVLGVVVAHEMGHVMGCNHDESESPCATNDADGSFFIMAPYVHLFTTRWSTCSRAFMTALFDNNLGECLNDEPEVSLYKYRDMLAGSVYDADQQCDMLFPGSTKCIVDKETFCEMLLCRTSPEECLSNEEPPADGTKCGENMWCYRKKCIEIGERPEAINGGWGEWGEFSECSRTCGGGVSISERECNNPPPENKGRYCIGERKQIKICNTQPCPAGSPSFREVQCEEHNSKPFDDQLYTWKAYFLKDEPCVLYCINNEYVYAKLEPRAKDGTRCKPGTKNMCISGTCMKVGCDFVINSDAVEDICGICKGDGTRCKITENVYEEPPGVGYQKVTTVPTGSRNIEFEELAPSVNTLAVSATDEKTFFLNGNNEEEEDGDKQIAKAEALYEHPEPGKESLFIHGPIASEIILYVVFYSPENVGYKYKFAELSTDNPDSTPSYHWELLDWSDCSVRCGGGEQQAKYSCVEENAGRVSDTFCNDIEKPPPLTKKCNEQPCKTKWRVGKWGKCHACKFKSGIRMREVECVRESPVPGTEDILVEDEECEGAKPGTRELCNSHKKCKTRRESSDFPEHMMQNIWKQTYTHMPEAVIPGLSPYMMQENVFNPDESRTNRGSCPAGGNKAGQNTAEAEPPTVKLKVGSLVQDKVPSEDIKLVRIPVRKTSLGMNLTDTGFESMGDKLTDSIDLSKAKELKGEEAAKTMEEIEKKAEHPQHEHDKGDDNHKHHSKSQHRKH